MFGRRKNQGNKLNQARRNTSKFGTCICPQCNYSVTHKRGTPCVSLVCPTCKIPLIRKENSENKKQQTVNNKESKSASFPTISTELCVACKACIKVCPTEAIIMQDGKAKIITEKCKNCRICVNICKVNAIT